MNVELTIGTWAAYTTWYKMQPRQSGMYSVPVLELLLFMGCTCLTLGYWLVWALATR